MFSFLIPIDTIMKAERLTVTEYQLYIAHSTSLEDGAFSHGSLQSVLQVLHSF